MRIVPALRRVLTDEHFVLLGYFGQGSDNGIGLAGTDAERRTLISLTIKDRGSGAFRINKKIQLPSEDAKIINVTTLGFTPGNPMRLVSTSDGSGVVKSFIYGDEALIATLPDSTAAPVVISDPKTLHPLIGLVRNKKLVWHTLDKNNQPHEAKHMRSIEASVPVSHSSMFLDVTGDLRPDLVLDELKTVDGGGMERVLSIYPVRYLDGSSDALPASVSLPIESGPVLFAPMRGRLSFDLVYACIEDGISRLHIRLNQSVPDVSELDKKPRQLDPVSPGAVFGDAVD